MAMRDDHNEEHRSNSNNQKNDAPQKLHVVRTLLNLVVGTLKWLFFSMLFSIAVSIIGLTFFWNDVGSEHEKLTLQTEVGYLASELRHSNFIAVLGKTRDSVIWDVPEHIGGAVGWVAKIFTENFQEYANSANYSARIFLVRVITVVTTIPIFFAYIVGAVGVGLVERSLRQMNLARESSSKFHLFYNNLGLPLVFLMTLYLSWPFTAHPIPFLLPSQILLGLLLFSTVAGYKKYF